MPKWRDIVDVACHPFENYPVRASQTAPEMRRAATTPRANAEGESRFEPSVAEVRIAEAFESWQARSESGATMMACGVEVHDPVPDEFRQEFVIID